MKKDTLILKYAAHAFVMMTTNPVRQLVQLARD